MGTINENDWLSPKVQKIIKIKARQLVGRHGFTVDDIKDIEQEITIHVWQRREKYDPTKAKYNTFVSRIIDKKIVNIIEYQHAQKRDCNIPCDSLDDEICASDDNSLLRHEVVSQDDFLRLTGKAVRSQEELQDLRIDFDIERFIQSLPPSLQLIARLLLDMKISEVARATGLPRSTVNDRRMKLRRILKERGLDINIPKKAVKSGSVPVRIK